MKLSAAAAFALTAATVLLHQIDVVQGATALDETQQSNEHIAIKVNLRPNARGWQAPVIDKTLERSPVEEQKPASFEKKRTQRPSHAKELVEHSRTHGTSLETQTQPTKDKDTHRQRVRVSYEKNSGTPSGQQAPPASRPQHKKRNPTEAAANSKASQTASGLQQQPDDVSKQDDGTGDLFESESGGMVTHQYYNATQIHEQARMVSAAVKSQMAESTALRDDSSTSVIASVAVAGLVVGVVGIIVAVVGLLRQYSEFAGVELESDLPTVEGDRVHPTSIKAEVVMAVASSGEGATDATDKSSYLPSDVEEEEETKEGDDYVC